MLQFSSNEHDFTGTADQWEERVFRAAVKFRVHRFYGIGQHDSCECPTFKDAIITIGEVRRELPDARCTVYAVAASGRFTLLAEKRWAEYLAIAS